MGMNENGELEMPKNEYQKKVDDLRRGMRTLPNLKIDDNSTEIRVGANGIGVEVVESPRNPYKVITEVVTATWGDAEYATAWPLISPENRFNCVKTALMGQTLPQAMEVSQWTFIVRGASRSAFDQHARQRVGSAFFSVGTRDNSRLDSGWRCPTELHPDNGGDPELYSDIMKHLAEYKRIAQKILVEGKGSFETTRSLAPQGTLHPYKFSSNLAALKGFISQRTMACEQTDTVQTAIEVWYAIKDQFPLIASWLKPRCDSAKHCVYHVPSKNETFSCLFSGCGRHRDPNSYATFQKSCSDYNSMGKQSGKPFPSPEEWKTYPTFDSLEESDKKLFQEDWIQK